MLLFGVGVLVKNHGRVRVGVGVGIPAEVMVGSSRVLLGQVL